MTIFMTIYNILFVAHISMYVQLLYTALVFTKGFELKNSFHVKK